MKPQNPAGSSDVMLILKSFFKTFVANVSWGNPLSFDIDGNGLTFTQDNGDGIIIRVGTVANPLGLTNIWSTANSPTVIIHNLGRRPVGYVVISKEATCDVYSGLSMVADSKIITLYNTSATIGTTLYIF